MIVFDTNVISEVMRPQPSARVLEWMRGEPPASLFTTAITEGELLYGIALLPRGRRRQSFEAAVTMILTEDFSGRILPFDSSAAREFADIAVRWRRSGRQMPDADARIAGIVRSRGAALATRNVLDFADCDLTVIDPWR